MERRRAALLIAATLILTVGLMVVQFASKPGSVSNAAPAEQEPNPSQPLSGRTSIFSDWVALGSGCRAKPGEAGDVTMESKVSQGDGSETFAMTFQLDQFHLARNEEPSAPPLAFARECSIRIRFGPPQGKRIQRISARTEVVSNKSRAGKLTLLSQLSLGAVTVAREVVVHEPGRAHQGLEHTFDLSPTAETEVALRAVSCSEGKIIGFDYTWLAEPETATDDVSVRLSGDRILVVDVELASCS